MSLLIPIVAVIVHLKSRLPKSIIEASIILSLVAYRYRVHGTGEYL